MPASLQDHFADAFEAGELLTAGESVTADVPFTLRIPATGDYEDSKGNKLPNNALLQLAYPVDGIAPADIANVTPAEVAAMELVGGAGGDASLPVITAADPAFDLLTETAPYKRIVKADATYSNAPLGFTTAIDFIWEYHPGDTGTDGFWTIDVFSFSGFVVPTHWINRRNTDGTAQGWALVEGFYAGGTTSATNFAGTPAATFPSGTMYYLEDTKEVVVFDLTRQDGYLTADGPTAGTFVVVAQPRDPNAAPWEANHAYTVGELVTANRISDGQLTLFAWDDSAANAGTPTDGTSGATFDATEEGRWIEIGEAALNLEILQSVEITVRGYVSSVTHASQLVLIDAAGNDYDSADWVYISDDSATVANAPGTVLQGSAFSPPVNDFRTIVLRYTGGATRRGLSAIRLQLRAGVPTTGVTSIKTKYFSGIAESWTNWGSEQDVFTYTLTPEPFDFVTDPVTASAAGIATVADQATLLALPVATLNDGDARSHGRTTYVWHADMTTEQADGLPTLEPTDKTNPGVDAGYWVQQVPELGSSFGDFRTSRTTIHTFGDASSIERVRFIASDQNYSNRKSLLQELEFAHFTAGGNGWTQVNGGATDADGFVSVEKQFELSAGRHYRVEIFTRFNPDDGTAIDWRVESQYSYNVDVINNIRNHSRLTIVDFEIVRDGSGAHPIALDPAVPDGAALILDTATTPPTLREGTGQLTGPAVERQVITRHRNQTVAFGDLNFMCPSTGGSQLNMRRGSNPSMTVTHFSTKWSNQQGAASEQTPTFTVSTSWRAFRSAGLNLTQHNNWQEGTFVCNGWLYNIQVFVGSGWNNNRFSCSRWRLDAVKGDPGNDGADGINGADAASIDHVSQTAGDSSPGTTDTYTLWADAGETVNLGTYDVPIPSGAVPLTDVLIDASPDSTATLTNYNFALGMTYAQFKAQYKSMRISIRWNNLYSDAMCESYVLEDFPAGTDLAVQDYTVHSTNAYHIKATVPSDSATTLRLYAEGSAGFHHAVLRASEKP